MTRVRRAGRSVALGVAILRVAILPVVIVGEGALDYPDQNERAFTVILLVAAAWALGVLAVRVRLWLSGSDGPAWLSRAEPAVDLLMLAALMYTSGGAFSNTRKAYFVVPFVAALRTGPRVTAAWAGVAIAVYLVVAAVHPSADSPRLGGLVLSQIVYLVWAGAFAVFLAAMLSNRSARETRLADDRGRLATQALEAEERERKRLAELLHDEVVQNLLAARQELGSWRRNGREESLERLGDALDTTLRQLRGHLFELHPHVLDHAGLPAALRALGDRAAERSGADVTVDVDPAAEGARNGLVTWLVRELLANAANHAQAELIEIEVGRSGGAVTVAVRDDGVGFAPGAAEHALERGHIGLAAARQRVEAAGGTLEVKSRVRGGAEVLARLPSPG